MWQPRYGANIDPQARACMRLEFAVVARALLDATWTDPAAGAIGNKYAANLRQAKRDRDEARAWFTDPRNRAHVDLVAENAGMEASTLWRIVDRFIVQSENPQPLQDALKRILE